MPNLRQLEYLVAVAETRHFRRAAERANTTQPTLSGQLKALEERLGAQLVERNAQRVVLTPIGNEVVDIARRMLRDAREIRSIAARDSKELRGLLRLALPSTIGPYLLPHVVPLLHKNYPELRLYVREELPEALVRLVEDGEDDIVITPLPVQGLELETEPLFREQMFLTVAGDDALAAKKMVKLGDIRGRDVLALGHRHQLHDAVATACIEAGARLRLEFQGTSLDMLREMVIMGLGVTFMPGLYVASELVRDGNVKVFEMRHPALRREIGIVWRKSSARHHHYSKLACSIRDSIPVVFGIERLYKS